MTLTGSGRSPHSGHAIARVDPALSTYPLGDSRNHSVLQRCEGDAGLQPGMVLEDLLGGHQPSVSPVHHLQFSDEPTPATAFPIQLSPLEYRLGLLHRDVVRHLHPYLYHLSADQHSGDT